MGNGDGVHGVRAEIWLFAKLTLTPKDITVPVIVTAFAKVTLPRAMIVPESWVSAATEK